MNKLKNTIEDMGKQDLLALQQAIDAGLIERLIAQKLAEYRNEEAKACAICGATLMPHEAIRVEFGPADLRKQAYFDATDCAAFFIKNNCNIQ